MDTSESIRKEADSSAEELYASYPIVMRHKPCLSIGLGWHSLLEELCFKLEKLCESDAKTHIITNDPPYIVSMKEKYGELNITIHGSLESPMLNEQAFHLVFEYESLSSSICEQCGREGRPTSTGWIKTLCKEHNHVLY